MKLLACFFFTIAFSFPSTGWGYSEHIHKHPDPSSLDDLQVEHLRAREVNRSNSLKVDVYLRNFNDWESRKIERAKEILEVVMNSPEFKTRVLNFTFKGERRFHRNEGMSNQQILDHLMTGAEDLMPEADGVMNFDLTLYTSWNPWSTVKGYTKPDTMRIWLHTKYFRRTSWTPVDVAANMAHEWVHKMGFGHAYENNPDRPWSVPYAIGRIVGQIAQEMGYSSSLNTTIL